MSPPSPLSVLSGALKLADKVAVSMEAVGNKIRLNSQRWDIREREVLRRVDWQAVRSGGHRVDAPRIEALRTLPAGLVAAALSVPLPTQ